MHLNNSLKLSDTLQDSLTNQYILLQGSTKANLQSIFKSTNIFFKEKGSRLSR